MKLIEFLITADAVERHFEILGDVESIKHFENTFLEFQNVLVYEVTSGDKVLFEPTARSWATGSKLDVYDVIHDVVNRVVRNNTNDFKVLSICDELKDFAAIYNKDIALVHEGRDIPYRIVNNNYWYVYELVLATSEYLYYCCDDQFIMLTTSTGEVVSDNYFAECGYFDSLENIENGSEEKLDFKDFPPNDRRF